MLSLGPSWLWSHGSWIYIYLCNWCLPPLMFLYLLPLRARCTTLRDKVCQWLAAGPPVSSTNETDCHDITEIFLKVVLNTIKTNQPNLDVFWSLNIFCLIKSRKYHFPRHRHGRDHTVVGLTTTCAISAYHH